MNKLSNKYNIIVLIITLLFTGCTQPKNYLPGYIEGEYTYISSGIDGTLFDLPVERGQSVNKGDLLYQLDQQPEKANVNVINSNIGNLQAQVNFSKIHLERVQNLYAKNATFKEDLDAAQTDYESKQHQLAAYQAQLIQTEWALDQKTIHAPVNGYVFDTFYRVGEKVAANHPVLAILAPENIKVLFYVPENLLSQIKLGQQITFSCDSCKNKTAATINYISPQAEYTPPIIYSKDTRDKLVYLIRASMPANIAQNFHPGQPIDVYLNP